MMDQDLARERVEQEELEMPFCDCGARTVPVARGGVLWLECSSHGQPRNLLRKLRTLDFSIRHTRRAIMADTARPSADPPRPSP